VWAAPVSALWVYCCAWHGPRTEAIAPAAAFALFTSWTFLRAWPDARRGVGLARLAGQAGVLAATLLLAIWIGRHGELWWQPLPGEAGRELPLAFPWYEPAGCVVAFCLSVLLARPASATLASGPVGGPAAT
jgi:hypothetical protein